MKYTDDLTVRVTYRSPIAPPITREEARIAIKDAIEKELPLLYPFIVVDSVEVVFAPDPPPVELDPDMVETTDVQGNVEITSEPLPHTREKDL